jgi:hypothetical protein
MPGSEFAPLCFLPDPVAACLSLEERNGVQGAWDRAGFAPPLLTQHVHKF